MSNKVILCHKCSGALTEKNDPRLYSCGCISSYARGFEEHLTAEQAVMVQIEATEKELAYNKKYRSDRIDMIERDERILARLRTTL